MNISKKVFWWNKNCWSIYITSFETYLVIIVANGAIWEVEFSKNISKIFKKLVIAFIFSHYDFLSVNTWNVIVFQYVSHTRCPNMEWKIVIQSCIVLGFFIISKGFLHIIIYDKITAYYIMIIGVMSMLNILKKSQPFGEIY